MQNSALPDYNSYSLNKRELGMSVATAMLEILVAAILCFNSAWAVPILLIYIPFHIRQTRNRLLLSRKWTLNLQFADALRAISTSLEAGYSAENAISEAYHDLSLIYSEQDMIMKELAIIIARIKNNQSVEDAFTMLARRSGIEDIANFAEVFATAKRTGGNIIAVIRITSEVIRTRIELSRELKTAIAAKKYESDIMKIVPCGILVYLRIFSGEMLAPLYGNVMGAVFMSVMLALYILFCRIADKIVEVRL